MVRIDKRGRPPQGGERYPSGDRKPPKPKKAGDGKLRHIPWSPAYVEAAVDLVARTFNDPRFKTAVGRLLMQGRLTPMEAATCGVIGYRYGRYERLQGFRRAARGPFYVSWIVTEGEQPKPRRRRDEKLPWDEQEEIDEIREAWAELQRALEPIPARVRTALELLCCEDRDIGDRQIEEARVALTHIGKECGLVERDRKEKPFVWQDATAKPVPGAGDTDPAAAADFFEKTVRMLEQGAARRAREAAAAAEGAAAQEQQEQDIAVARAEEGRKVRDRRDGALGQLPAAGFVS